MEIKQIIKQVATLLGLSNVMEANLDSNNLDAQTQKDINLIISSINEVLCDIATDYLPLKQRENITVTNGSFDLTDLSFSFHKLIKVETDEPYKVFKETLFIKNGTYSVVYTYLPEVYELDDDIEDVDVRLTSFALSYAVAAEYCLISGNYSESELWASKFEEDIKALKRTPKVPSLKSRRWI